MGGDHASAVAKGVPFQFVDISMRIRLSPRCLYPGGHKRGVDQVLASRVMKWLPEAGGVVLAVVSWKPRSNLASLACDVGDESLFVSLEHVRLLVFAPQPGNVIAAKITNVSMDHIGLLIYNVFSGVILRPRAPARQVAQSANRKHREHRRALAGLEIEQLVHVKIVKVSVPDGLVQLECEYVNTIGKSGA